jgi:hypothetical protein
MPPLFPSSQNSLNYTTGIGVPARVTLSGTAAGGNSVTQQLQRTVDGLTYVAEQLRGAEYYLLMTSSSDTCQLTAGIVDVNGAASTVDSGNTYTYTSWQAPPTVTSMSNTGSPAGTELVSFSAATMGTGWTPAALKWQSDVVTVSSSGLISANAAGWAIVECRYPLSRAANNPAVNGLNTTDNPQFIAALLWIQVN